MLACALHCVQHSLQSRSELSWYGQAAAVSCSVLTDTVVICYPPSPVSTRHPSGYCVIHGQDVVGGRGKKKKNKGEGMWCAVLTQSVYQHGRAVLTLRH